jgi:Spy/CpxP family protein refolding chaperone
MRTRLVSLTLATALAAGSLVTFGWASTDGASPAGAGPGGRWAHKGGPGHRLAELAAVLNLTDAQKAQIKGLFEAQRPVVKPLVESLRTARTDLHKAFQSNPFDETAVRSAAQKEAAAHVELTVARASLHSKISAVLTPDQQSLLQKLRPLLHDRGPREGAGPF